VKRYSFDDHPEHKAQLGEWAQRWIDNAMSTAPADRHRMTEAIDGLYRAADLAHVRNAPVKGAVQAEDLQD